VPQAVIKIRLFFETNLYLYKYPSDLARLFFLLTLAMKKEQTEFEISANKITQRKEYNIPNTTKV
jgi:hypothetical protein